MQQELPIFISMGNDRSRNSLYGLKVAFSPNLKGQRRREPDTGQWTQRNCHGKKNSQVIVATPAKAAFQIAPLAPQESIRHLISHWHMSPFTVMQCLHVRQVSFGQLPAASQLRSVP